MRQGLDQQELHREQENSHGENSGLRGLYSPPLGTLLGTHHLGPPIIHDIPGAGC